MGVVLYDTHEARPSWEFSKLALVEVGCWPRVHREAGMEVEESILTIDRPTRYMAFVHWFVRDPRHDQVPYGVVVVRLSDHARAIALLDPGVEIGRLRFRGQVLEIRRSPWAAGDRVVARVPLEGLTWHDVEDDSDLIAKATLP